MENACRVCMKEYNKMLSVFEESSGNGENLSPAERIFLLAGVQIQMNDGLPQSICHTCHYLLKRFYQFKILIESSDRSLRSLLLSEENGIVKTDDQMSEEDKSCAESTHSHDNIIMNNSKNPSTIIVPMNNAGVENSVTQLWGFCVTDIEVSDQKDHFHIEDISKNIKTLNEIDTMAAAAAAAAAHYTMNNKEDTIKKTKVERFQSCIDCGNILIDENKWISNQEGIKVSELRCGVCSETFESMKHHETKITDPLSVSLDALKQEPLDEKYFCSQCNQGFVTAGDCSEHVRTHLALKWYKCSKCSRSFRRNSTRNRHELTHIEKKLECDLCGQFFKNKIQIRCHLNQHTNGPPVCVVCNKLFRHRHSLKMHIKRHTGESLYDCEVCKKSYFSASELNRHIQKHQGKRNFQCTLCPRSFFSKSELSRHSRYHSGDKKYKCHLCSNAYYESSHLKIHLRVHTGEKPYVCEICAKAFISKSKLFRHQKIHPKITLD